MKELNSSSRLKVKNDTFYLPDPEGGVYFRNNTNSFRIAGDTIYQWIEKLLPMFNGVHTLAEITTGLTPPYRNRVYEIAESLYVNGYVRDTSLDQTHDLTPSVLNRYASQIEFIESFVDSGAYRLQRFRQTKVLAIGSGQLLTSLITAMMECGLPQLHFMVTDGKETDRERIEEIVNETKKEDVEAAVKELPYSKDKESLLKEIAAYDWIVFVSPNREIDKLKQIQQVCIEAEKAFFPILYLGHVGIVGPVVQPELESNWESAWRRIHQTILKEEQETIAYSTTAGAMLTNTAVFELFKKITGVGITDDEYRFYLLEIETLRGDWISYFPHLLAEGTSYSPILVKDLDRKLENDDGHQNNTHQLLEYFRTITAEETGVFHLWAEESLKQLPLSQCYVQAINPLSEGPASLLEKVICTGLTHEQARREAGLIGIEMYVKALMAGKIDSHTGVGAGETLVEAVFRGLQSYLEQALTNKVDEDMLTMEPVQIETSDDDHSKYYLQALTILDKEPLICLHTDELGFPILCIETSTHQYRSIGLTTTLALRTGLQQAISDIQNDTVKPEITTKRASFATENVNNLAITSCENLSSILQTTNLSLKKKHKKLVVYDLSCEPFLKTGMAGVFAVQIVGEAQT